VSRFKVGYQIHPQHCAIDDLRRAWRAADELGVDSIWTWDHFYPLYGEPDGPHFEGWSLLAAMACETARPRFGMLVTCNGYRNPEMLADIARTVDHLSGGRLNLGIGAGWFERDYDEYGYEFGTAGSRLALLEESLERIKARLPKLNPQPVGPMPIMIGGGGERVTLRLVAQYADMWNTFGPAENFGRRNAVLDEWCAKLGRDPASIERTVLIGDEEVEGVDELLAAGAQHLILRGAAPFDTAPLERLLSERDR